MSHTKHFILCAMSHTLRHSTQGTGAPSSPLPVPRSPQHCHDLRPISAWHFCGTTTSYRSSNALRVCWKKKGYNRLGSRKAIIFNVQRYSFAGNPKIRTYVLIGSGDEEKWFGSLIDKPHGEWNASSETTMQEFAESGHPVFRFSSPLSRGVLKRRRKEKVSMHCNGQPNSAEVQMTNISSINQLSIYRAVLTWYLERRSEGDKCFSKHPPPHFTRTRDKTSTCRREIDRVPHTNTVQSNSRAGDKFLAKQDSRSL